MYKEFKKFIEQLYEDYVLPIDKKQARVELFIIKDTFISETKFKKTAIFISIKDYDSLSYKIFKKAINNSLFNEICAKAYEYNTNKIQSVHSSNKSTWTIDIT